MVTGGFEQPSTIALVSNRTLKLGAQFGRIADEPLAIRKRYGVTEEISLSFLRARQASGLLV
jgi:hypothetical protein